MAKDKNIKNKTPFTVPTGYFDRFESRLMEKIKSDSQMRKHKGLFNRKRLIPLLAVAAVILLFLWVGFYNYEANEEGIEYAMFTDEFNFTEDEILDYLNATEEIDTEIIMSSQ